MKLLSCYIEGYGKIKGKTYDFLEGITTLYKPNGEGKTTLASFIKAMFYGLKGYRKGSTEFCDREHFYPFDGGLFGGNITFEWKGQKYKIERFFGDKSETADTLRVFKNGEVTDELGSEPGKEIFGLDKESFERTAFLDGGEVELSSTSGIHARLNGILEGGNEENCLDGALERLDKATKAYKKSRTGADKVSQETAKLARLSDEISNALTVKLALEEKYARENALRQEIEEISRAIVIAQQQNEKLSQREHYDSILERVYRAERELQSIGKKYPLGLPALEEIDRLNAYMVRGKELQTDLERSLLSPVDEENLAALSARFKGGVPNEQLLDEMDKKAQRLAEVEGGIELAERQTVSERERAFVAKFSQNSPTEEELSLGREKMEEYVRLKRAYEEAPTTFSPVSAQKREKKYAILGICAAIILVFGGVLMALSMPTFGGIALGVGLIALLLGGFVYLNGKSAQNVGQEDPRCRQLIIECQKIEDDLKALLLPLGYRTENGIAYDFSLLQSDFAAYRRLREEEEASAKSLAEKRAEAMALSKELTVFFADYGLDEAPFFTLNANLRAYCREYADLSARKAQATEKFVEIQAQIAQNQENIIAFQRKYGLARLSVMELTEDRRSAAHWEEEFVQGKEKAASFKSAKGLDEQASFEKADLSALQARLQEKQEEKSKLLRQIAEDERLAESLDGYEEERTATEGLLKEYKQKHRLLTATEKFIRQADGRLKDKYVAPIRGEFVYYAELIERTLGEKIVMTKEFELRFERQGIERSEQHLSSGQRSICALCLRLALLKNMYRDGLPFLVLDDPFMSLDEEHFARVAAVLKALSKDTQMIYFTCHESRRV